LINFLLFMKSNNYRSLSERLLKVKMQKIDPSKKRELDFTYVNRVIVWNSIGNSLSYLLPFIDVGVVKSLFNQSSKLTEQTTLDENEMGTDNFCQKCAAT